MNQKIDFSEFDCFVPQLRALLKKHPCRLNFNSDQDMAKQLENEIIRLDDLRQDANKILSEHESQFGKLLIERYYNYLEFGYEQFDRPNETIKIVCGSITLVYLVVFLALISSPTEYLILVRNAGFLLLLFGYIIGAVVILRFFYYQREFNRSTDIWLILRAYLNKY